MSQPSPTTDLQRFVDAQERRGSYRQALAELRAGAKQSHWMWYVFPQLAGLGDSEMSRHYALADLAQARAYLEHPLLGARLAEATQALLALPAHTSAREVMGSVDAQKLRSCWTLFSLADPHYPLWRQALERFYESPDPLTLRLLGTQPGG